jgi:FKBP-type peptidyl-prolyl cis-trans isomerase
MVRMRLLAFAAASVALAAPAAAQEAQVQPPERDADWHNRQHLFLYSLPAAEGWQRTHSGLRYRKVGGTATGPRPDPSATVTIHYAGRFIDGAEFDSSIARGTPATFPLPRLIKGWQEGVPLMSVGERFEFAIPASLGYGYKGKGPIPGGATLLFTVELIAIPAPAAG